MLGQDQLHIDGPIFDLDERGELVFVGDVGDGAEEGVEEGSLDGLEGGTGDFSAKRWEFSLRGRVGESAWVPPHYDAAVGRVDLKPEPSKAAQELRIHVYIS